MKSTKEDFFEALKAQEQKGCDIMPRIVSSSYPYRSDWVNQRTGVLFGHSQGLTGGGNEYYLETTNA